MSFEKGELLRLTKGGFRHYATGGYRGGVETKIGDEVVVTSVMSSGLRVRRYNGTGRVFVVPSTHVERYPRQLGEVPEGGIALDDPRIAWIFEDAARLADRFGYCSVYEKIAEELGMPGRERTFNLKVLVADGVEVTAKVVARSRTLAEKRLRDQVAANGGTAITA